MFLPRLSDILESPAVRDDETLRTNRQYEDILLFIFIGVLTYNVIEGYSKICSGDFPPISLSFILLTISFTYLLMGFDFLNAYLILFGSCNLVLYSIINLTKRIYEYKKKGSLFYGIDILVTIIILTLCYFLFLYGLNIRYYPDRVKRNLPTWVNFLFSICSLFKKNIDVKNGLIFSLILMDFQINMIELVYRWSYSNIIDINFGLNYNIVILIQQVSMISSYFLYLFQSCKLHLFWEFNIFTNVLLTLMIHVMKMCSFIAPLILSETKHNLNSIFINIVLGILIYTSLIINITINIVLFLHYKNKIILEKRKHE
ncbi:hypothetical protein HZS_159, partial [Henneguya salminicola]